MAQFGDLCQNSGLEALNDHLATRSYIEGYEASAADFQTCALVSAFVDAGHFPHVARWHSHILALRTEPKYKRMLSGSCQPAAQAAAAPASATPQKPAKQAAKQQQQQTAANDDDFDLFGDDDEGDDALAKAREEAAKKKKSEEDNKQAKKKDKPLPKSLVTLDVKPWEADTNLEELDQMVRSIEQEGLTWGKSEQFPIAYGVKKIRITCVIIDELVPSMDDIIERIQEFESHVQSVDIAAWNKL